MNKIICCILLCFLAVAVPAVRAECAGRGKSRPAPVTAPLAARNAQSAAGLHAAKAPSPAGNAIKSASCVKSIAVKTPTKAKKVGAETPGLAGFAHNTFLASGVGKRAAAANPPEKKYGPTQEQNREDKLLTFGDKQNITVSVQSDGESADRLTPDRRAFPGGPESPARIHDKESPEVSVKYKLNPAATTRLTVNPSNADSPLYRPPENTRNLNAAGLYMDMSVRDDLNLTLGGEYSDVQDSRPAHKADGAAGAALGITWNF
ncbi:MAG: hypothetical protein LBQ51_08220 [Desulfovibrio sp.]|jgi:hypothetical protein|nr:hypothetical protein [Desulfovibrio sp.]